MHIPLLSLAAAAFGAGMIDAVVGGGGLILVPVLFSTFPTQPAATLFGTNKGGATWGTAVAARTYLRRVHLRWSTVLPATATAFVGALLGAYTITRVDSDFFRRALPFVLTAVLGYTLWRKDLGHHHAPRLSGRMESTVAMVGGGLIGFYDGFFGPGTGNFLVFMFVRVFGFDFLHAAASAKVVNVACNLAALALFSVKGHVMWRYAALIAVCNIGGNITGSRLALNRGTQFVRAVFIVVVVLLIAKTAHDAFIPSPTRG